MSQLIEQSLSGTKKGNFELGTICIDSRIVNKQSTFLAYKGSNNDGHNYLFDVIDQQVKSVIIEEDFYNSLSEDNKNKIINALIVKDTYQTMLELANLRRLAFKGKVIAITGSVGKTTLKDLTHHALSYNNSVYSTKGNFNNEIGLPLMLCNLTNDYKVAILELGMSNKGEILFLSNLSKPNIAVITDISNAHSENFSSLEDIAKAKLEILEGLQPNASVFIRKDISTFNVLLEACRKNKNVSNISTFAIDKQEDSDIYISNEVIENNYMNCKAINKNSSYNLKLMTIYKSTLSLSAVACSIYTDTNNKIDDDFLSYFSSFKVTKGRGSINSVNINNKNITLIDDSYNANPTSMINAINSLFSQKSKKLILVIGDMLELGNIAQHEHSRVAECVKKLNPQMVYCKGNLMCAALNEHLDKTKIELKSFDNEKQIIDHLQNLHVEEDTIILIKGSYSTNLHKVADKLLG